jgi:hypothetical protein
MCVCVRARARVRVCVFVRVAVCVCNVCARVCVDIAFRPLVSHRVRAPLLRRLCFSTRVAPAIPQTLDLNPNSQTLIPETLNPLNPKT